MDDKAKLTEAVKKATSEAGGKETLSCKKAFVLAAQFNIQPSEIGCICNQQKIKIVGCQLGCFK